MAEESYGEDTKLSKILSKLWQMDENRCVNGNDYEINMQGYVRSTRNKVDRARDAFFENVNAEIFSRPTYKAFFALLDNYELETGYPEYCSEEERIENKQFIDAVMDTKVMQEAHKYLVSEGKVEEDLLSFKRFLYNLWFKFYRRTRGNRATDSSAFEHVFVGETRDTEVLGLHNWIQLYIQEKRGIIDYKGYFKWGTDNSDDPRLVTVQFSMKGTTDKPMGSSFLGTSPELELALYTICFLMSHGDKVTVRLEDNLLVDINVHRMGPNLGSAYPSKHKENY